MDYQLELIDVAKQYKEFLAVDSVNLQIEKGEIVSFLGASGCGKTTTLRMIAGLIEPTRGTIRIQGRDMNGIPPHKRDISMVFQNYALFPHLSVYENIVYGLKTRKIKDKKVLMEKAREMMNLVQLEGVENRLPKELSGGQQQRVSLARAMIVEPKMMLFDEPPSALDPELRHEVLKVMQDLAEEGMTMVIVTHEIGFAEKVASRLIFIDKGRIAEDGNPQVLIKNPPSQRLQEFLQHVS